MDHPPGGQQYRTPSKIIAVVDIALSSLEMLGLLAYAIMDVDIPPILNKVEHLGNLPEDKVGLVTSMLVWIHLHYSVLKLLFAFRLLTASKQDTPIREAVDLAKSWRTFSVVLLVLFILFPGVVAGLIEDLRYLLSTGFRVACVYVVNKFIRELKTELRGDGGEFGGDYTKLPSELEGTVGEGLLVGTGARYRILTLKISRADVILTHLELVVVGLLGVDATETLLLNFHHFHYFPAEYLWIASYSIFAVHFLLTAFLMFKSIELGAATYPPSELPEAIVISREWRVIKILPLLLNSVPFLAGFGPWALIWILFRLSAILIVHRYLRELEKRLEEEGGARGGG